MSWTKYALVCLLLVIQTAVSQIGVYAGYTVNGVPVAGSYTEGSPGILGIVEWVWDSITFMFHMTTFQVDDVPVAVGAIFVVMGLLTVFIIVNLIRGS